MPREELYLDHNAPREKVPLVTEVRGTVIVASMRGLRNTGNVDRYLAALEPQHHDRIASLTAATWLPIDFALAHYEACERLVLDPTTIETIGRESGRFINETVLTVVSKLSKESGASPFLPLSYANKLVSRTWRGSSMQVWKLGPKEARFEWIQQPLARVPYFRAAFGAFSHAICKMFTTRTYVRETPMRPGHDNELGYRISWV